MANVKLLTDVKHWRDRSEEAFSLAEHARDSNARRILFEIAEGYARLAAQAERWHEDERSEATEKPAQDANVKKAMLGIAKSYGKLADHGKLGRRGPNQWDDKP